MIDFSKYTLTELLAMSDVLDDLTYRMSISEVMKAHLLPFHYYKEVTGAVAAAIDQQARHAGDPPAGAPPAVNCCNIDRCGVCLTDCPYTDEPLPAKEPGDLQALVDTLSRCSDRLAALALAEDKHFAEDSQMDTFIKLTVLRNANRSIIDLLADIRDHYDGLH